MSDTPDVSRYLTSVRSDLSRPAGKWGQRLATATAIWQLGKLGHQQYRNRLEARRYTVTVMESEAIYGEAHARVLDLMPEPAQRSLTAHTARGGDTVPSDDFEDTRSYTVALRYDGTRQQIVRLHGHDVRVVVDREDGKSASSDAYGSSYRSHKLVFSAQDQAGKAAIVAFLQSCADALATGRRQPTVITTGRWNDWRALKDVPMRPLDSVHLPAGHLDGLRADLERFLSWEKAYARLGRPWHRGYLLHGPPGTGKSSLAQALAGHYGMNVYVLPLSDLEGDATLTNLVGSVPARSVLLLEDVDVAHAATDRDDDRKGATLAGLLNVLDGVGTPHGLVTILTTNHRDRLEDALIRDGRVDYELELGLLTPDQAADIIRYATGITPAMTFPDPLPPLTPAALVGVLAKHLDNPWEANLAALRLLGVIPDERCGCEDPASCVTPCPDTVATRP